MEVAARRGVVVLVVLLLGAFVARAMGPRLWGSPQRPRRRGPAHASANVPPRGVTSPANAHASPDPSDQMLVQLHGVPKSGTTWVQLMVPLVIEEALANSNQTACGRVVPARPDILFGCFDTKQGLEQAQAAARATYKRGEPVSPMFSNATRRYLFSSRGKHFLVLSRLFGLVAPELAQLDVRPAVLPPNENPFINERISAGQIACMQTRHVPFTAASCVPPVWHRLAQALKALCASGCPQLQRLRHVLVVRDPRDAAVSWMHYKVGIIVPNASKDVQMHAGAQAVLRNASFYVAHTMQFYDFWTSYIGRYLPVLVLFYEDLVADLPASLLRIQR